MNDELAAACEVLGEIMLAMQARKLLERGVPNAVIRAKMLEQNLTDHQIGELAARGFEHAATALADASYPGSSSFACGAEDMEKR
jgi:hypothetical protein